MTRLAAVFAALLLVGCTSEKRFNELASGYLGLTEEQMLERLGPESNSRDTSNARFLSWQRSVTTRPYYSVSQVGDGAFIVAPLGGNKYHCTITYRLVPKEVIDLITPGESTRTAYVSVSYTYRGNACRA